MSFSPLTLRPGVNVEATQHALQTGYNASAFGRFRAGFFEKVGGWQKYFPFSLGAIPRALSAFIDLSLNKWLGIGTTTSLDVISQGALTNITPQQFTTNVTPNFTTVSTQTTVIVTDATIVGLSNNLTTFDSVEFRVPISVGGIILSGVYPIAAVTGQGVYDITAASAATGNVSNGGAVPIFTVNSGSSSVNVLFPNHGYIAGKSNQFFVAPVATVLGASGITIQGQYAVVGVVDANNFTISASTAALATATSVSMNGGNVQLLYYLALGPVGAGTGYGFGGYGSGPYSGTGTAGSQLSGTNITAVDWTLDNWDQTLLSNPAGGGVYQWTPGSGVQQAQLVATAPAYNSGIFVGAPYKVLFAYGSTLQRGIGIVQDPNTWRTSDTNDFTFWQTNVINPSTNAVSQAVQNRIPTGTGIKAGLATPNQVLLWTDIDLWSVTYQNLPNIWVQNKIGANCGTVGRHAVGQMAGVVYWWGIANFFALAGGAPVVIPCAVWDTVFQDIDPNNRSKCWVETVTAFNEVWWFWVSQSGAATNGGECDSYAKVNVLDGSWDFGRLPRSIGLDNSTVAANPIMCSPAGLIYNHETTYDADGAPLSPSFLTGFFYLSEAQDFQTVDEFYPDFHYTTFSAQTPNATVQLTFFVRNYPNDIRTYGPFLMQVTTKKLNFRFRGREVAIQMLSNDTGSWWRIGKPYFRLAPSGRR